MFLKSTLQFQKPELYIKEEPTEQSEGFSFYSSDSDDRDQDDDDSLQEYDKDEMKVVLKSENYFLLLIRNYFFQITTDKDVSNKSKEEFKSDVKRDKKVVEESNSSDSDSDSDTYIPKNTNHKCLKCNKYCASSSSLKRHEQTVHTEEKDKIRHEKRLKSKPKPKPFKCDVCRKVSVGHYFMYYEFLKFNLN